MASEEIERVIEAARRVAMSPSVDAYRNWGSKQVYSGDLLELLEALEPLFAAERRQDITDRLQACRRAERRLREGWS